MRELRPRRLMKTLSMYSELVKSSAMTYRSGRTLRASSNMYYTHRYTHPQLSHPFRPSIVTCINAAFLWAPKVVFTSFPVGNYVSMKSEVVITSGKVGKADSIQSFRVGKTWRLSMIWKVKYFNLYLTVSAYDRKATLFVTVCGCLSCLSTIKRKFYHTHYMYTKQVASHSNLGISYFQSRKYDFPSLKKRGIRPSNVTCI